MQKETRKGRIALVYRKSLKDKWRCSWCSLTHEDFEKVVEHENREHAGRKE
ncbi:MAG: hypothetical protein OEZ35_07740 [Candidatus Bathyarchaeota archaeon]|nr:hypothetical protein [Candidatus Bathyarchaeota archaeon]